MDLKVLDIVEGTSVDGPGLRTSVYFSGCTHHCDGCHNEQSWNIEAGKLTTIDAIIEVIAENDFNVTFSGGDPLMQVAGVAELAKQIKLRLGKTIWCYTGYRWEQIVNEPKYSGLLSNIDVIVDGRFILSQRDISLRFKGSGNQRIIDVKASMLQHKVVLWNS